jgi:hypothetical protein
MDAKLTLEWHYTPADFLGAPFSLEAEGSKLKADNGKVTAHVPDCESDNSVFQRIHDKLNSLFLAAQLFDSNPFALSDFTIVRTSEAGIREITQRGMGILKITGSGDFVVTDAAGNITRDTRAERIRERQEFAALAAKHHADPTAAAILKSYRAAVDEKQIELIRLYEIRDALKRKFNGDHKAQKTLGISKDDWKRLGYLASKAPLNQGRHRGWNVGELRDATDAELTEARTIAKNMIRAYLKYLEKVGPHV